MSDSSIMAALFTTDAIIQLQYKNNRTFVLLTEKSAPKSIVKIYGLPKDAVVVKVDKFPAPETIFRGTRSECKRADFVIISPKKRCILYIEMKLSKAKRKDITSQLAGAAAVIDYCKAIVHGFWKKSTFLSDYQEHFVFFTKTGTSKQRTVISKRKPGDAHDTPENAANINTPNYTEFNKLVGTL